MPKFTDRRRKTLSALALAGYFWAGEWFELWMAFVDGGGLMLGGLWMRRS